MEHFGLGGYGGYRGGYGRGGYGGYGRGGYVRGHSIHRMYGYPSVDAYTYPWPYDYTNYYSYSPCTCSDYESAAHCARRRAGYNCL